MIMAPGTVLYSIPNGPRKKVSTTDKTTLLRFVNSRALRKYEMRNSSVGCFRVTEIARAAGFHYSGGCYFGRFVSDGPASNRPKRCYING